MQYKHKTIRCKMESQALHVMTITNSIIGVSLLAMPYCFKQCGIILSICMLLLSNVIARLCCHLMLKSAVIARRRTFEFLAFHAFGSLGKFAIEIGLIGFLLGTSIAYFVVMGDLGPAIVAKLSNAKATDTLRTSILLALALFCVLPLGLLRNIDSLSSVCTVTVGFYFCLVLKIISEAVPHLISGDWINKVEVWRPAGILQCLPIFSMALSCQTQIFEIYQALPTASLEKMNILIRAAVNICTGVYIFVGVFGYVAFATQTFTGNILMSFSPSFISDLMKIGFVLSLAFSFPLIIFPCRASLNSLLCRHYSYSLHDGTDKYIPENRFKALTFIIILISLVVGVLIPNIELVLGLLGSTIGVMVCVLFPATCFICVSTKNTNERMIAQIMLFIGVLTMVLGTYANLYAIEEITTTPAPEKIRIDLPKVIDTIEKIPDIKIENNIPVEVDLDKKDKEELEVVRHEPPQPIEPVVEEPKPPNEDESKVAKLMDREQQQVEPQEIQLNEVKKEPISEIKKAPVKNSNVIEKREEVDIEAIQKEEKEILEDEKQKLKEVEQKNLDLINKIEKQNEAQQKVVEESKKLLEEIKQRQNDDEEMKKLKEEKMKAVEEIQEIAKKAIERLTADDAKKRETEKVKPVKELPEDNKLKILPLPLVISNRSQAYNNKEVEVPGIKTTMKPVISIEETKQEGQIPNTKLNSTNNVKVKAEQNVSKTKDEIVLHREIRSADDKIAEKTEESCNKDTNINEELRTEPSLIKMITKLSESDLVSVKLPDVNNKDLDLESLKRDLKSYKDKRK